MDGAADLRQPTQLYVGTVTLSTAPGAKQSPEHSEPHAEHQEHP